MSKKNTQVKYSAITLVWIEIKGKFIDAAHTRLDEENVIGQFMQWMMDENIYSVKTTVSGGGYWIGGFLPEDAERVQKWLGEQGVRRVQHGKT